MFYKELIDIPDVKALSLDAIFEEHSSAKFQHHCMCLTLQDIQLLYKFFREYKNEFSQKSKQSVSVLTDDIDYMDKEAKILSDQPIRNDSMLFKNH